MKVNLKATAKEDIVSTWESRTLHKASWGECWTLATGQPGRAPITQIELQNLSIFLSHLSLLLPCFLLQQLRKVLSKPLLVIFHCTRLQQFEELSKDRDGSNNNNLSLGFPLTMFLILLEQTQGLLAHDKVSMGVVAVVILFSE